MSVKTSIEVKCLGCSKMFTIEGLDMADKADRALVDSVQGKGAYCPTCDAQASGGDYDCCMKLADDGKTYKLLRRGV